MISMPFFIGRTSGGEGSLRPKIPPLISAGNACSPRRLPRSPAAMAHVEDSYLVANDLVIDPVWVTDDRKGPHAGFVGFGCHKREIGQPGDAPLYRAQHRGVRRRISVC